MKYRKKPVVIDAIQWDGTPKNLVNIRIEFPQMKVRIRTDIEPEHFGVYIKTLEGEHIVSPGDYIIKGVAGEFYPCKPEIFEKTYETIGVPRGLPPMAR